MRRKRRRVCFVTGTRAEFGLMRRTLGAIRDHPKLSLQLIVTGMHLDRTRGRSIDEIRDDSFFIDATVPWRGPPAIATGTAISAIARHLSRLKTDLVLVVGDRVEAFAAASAAHLSGIPVAHVHGGDRAQGQVDDSLRHAITKLAHIHFAATKPSAQRLIRLGEDRWRVQTVGSPGIDNVVRDAQAEPFFAGRRFVLVLLHPTDRDEAKEFRRAGVVLHSAQAIRLPVVIIYPNNDPGSNGIVRCWRRAERANVVLHENLPRPAFLAALRDCAVLVGNSSAGIIEAASFGTPVVDIGARQAGRLHGSNVQHAAFSRKQIVSAIQIRCRDADSHRAGKNIYRGLNTSVKIARRLSTVSVDQRLLTKLIAY